METVFELCFCVGLIVILVSFLLGQVVNICGLDGLDWSIADVSLPIPFSPLLVFLFLTIFGGGGMLVQRYVGKRFVVIGIIGVVIVALGICLLIHRYILLPLKKAENTSAASKEELIGLLAKVNERIPADGFGEITYVIHGNSYVAPAKSATGKKIPKGTEVSICWIEDYVFFVVQLEEVDRRK